MQNDEYKAIIDASNVKAIGLRKNLIAWAQINLRDYPWRKNLTPFLVLITEVLLRRTTATAVLRIYPDFIKRYGNLSQVLNSQETDLEIMLSSIGYQKERAKILKEIAKHIANELNGTIPSSKEELLKIPHVGDYTTGAVLSLGYNQPSAMVDTNVKRIYGRIFLSCLPKKAQNRFIDKAAAICVPKKMHKTYNFALLDLGALICTYSIPRCKICPIKEQCDYFSRKLPSR